MKIETFEEFELLVLSIDPAISKSFMRAMWNSRPAAVLHSLAFSKALKHQLSNDIFRENAYRQEDKRGMTFYNPKRFKNDD